MKLILAACVAAFTSSLSLFAQLNIPSDGSDGALVISNSTSIDLSQAVPGSWSSNNTPNAGKGIYDSNQWAVVFKYSSVFVSNVATLTFINHPTHAPVVWLVNGNVRIDGAVSLDGQSVTVSDLIDTMEPGPGGYRGAAADGGGFGPGGGYGNVGYYTTTEPYGNLEVVPLIGGSGGYGSPSNGPGGAGGGAILIAAAGTITINGSCHANGGSADYFFISHSGSGGAIRLIANQILGSGTVQATGGDNGRIRLEATNASSLNVSPFSTVVSPTFPATIWPASNAPTVQVVSVSNSVINLLSFPADPKAVMATSGDDLTIVTTNTVVIRLVTANFPTNGNVNVYIKPRDGGGQAVMPATCVGGDSNQANWQVSTTLPLNHTVIQARAFN